MSDDTDLTAALTSIALSLAAPNAPPELAATMHRQALEIAQRISDGLLQEERNAEYKRVNNCPRCGHPWAHHTTDPRTGQDNGCWDDRWAPSGIVSDCGCDAKRPPEPEPGGRP